MLRSLSETIAHARLIPDTVMATLARMRAFSIQSEQQYGTNLTPILKQFIRFASVGAVGTLAHYATLILLVQIMALNAVLASTAGFVIGAITNYKLNYHYTFASDKRHAEAMSKFFVVAFVGMFFNGLVMYFCVDLLDMLYLFAQVVATVLVLLWNFFANRCWTFHEHRPEKT